MTGPDQGFGKARNIYQCGKCGLALFIDVAQKNIRFRYVRCWDCGTVNDTT